MHHRTIIKSVFNCQSINQSIDRSICNYHLLERQITQRDTETVGPCLCWHLMWLKGLPVSTICKYIIKHRWEKQEKKIKKATLSEQGLELNKSTLWKTLYNGNFIFKISCKYISSKHQNFTYTLFDTSFLHLFFFFLFKQAMLSCKWKIMFACIKIKCEKDLEEKTTHL